MSDKNEFTITTQRFRKLIDNEKYAKVPRAEIAKATDCDTSTITKYYNGQRQLSVDSIIKFSKYFNVSSDYLLGLSDVSTANKDLQFICDYTGLELEAVKRLKESQDVKKLRKTIGHTNNTTLELLTINKLITSKEMNLLYLYLSVYVIDLQNKLEDYEKILQLDNNEIELKLIERHKTLKNSELIDVSLFEKNNFVELQKIQLSREFEKIIEQQINLVLGDDREIRVSDLRNELKNKIKELEDANEQ